MNRYISIPLAQVLERHLLLQFFWIEQEKAMLCECRISTPWRTFATCWAERTEVNRREPHASRPLRVG